MPQREHLDSNFENLLEDYKQIADSSDDAGSATAALMQNEAITIGNGSLNPKQTAMRGADKYIVDSGPSTRKAPEEAKVRY